MSRPSKGKINVIKIAKDHLYQGKTAKYLDFSIWPNKDGTDAYGNTHYITQEISKEARDRGERGAIIGNIRLEHADRPAEAPARTAPKPAPKPQADPDLDVQPDDVPF